jgi:hypothetical protein
MCSERKQIVRQAFDKIRSGDCATLDDIAKHYDPEHHPEVVSGNATPEAHYRTFLSHWGLEKPSDSVSLAQFESFYHPVSTQIKQDADFIKLLRSEWHI